MPNTPMLIGEAMSAISPGRYATEEQLVQVTGMLRAVGRVVRVPESQQDNVTALSGSGPAYFFYLVEAMTDAGILLGLPRAVAADLLVQTALGAAVMLRDHEVTAARLESEIDALTSERPYKKAWELDRANSLILESRGVHFDPEIVDAFYDAYDQVLEIKGRYQDADMIDADPNPLALATA